MDKKLKDIRIYGLEVDVVEKAKKNIKQKGKLDSLSIYLKYVIRQAAAGVLLVAHNARTIDEETIVTIKESPNE